MTDRIGQLDRRELLKRLGMAGVAGAASAMGPLAPLGPRPAGAADKLVVGVIYVGPRDDYGYNQAHRPRPRRR